MIDRALQRHGDPFVQINAVGQAAVVVRGRTQAVFGDAAEIVALRQSLDAVFERGRRPELLLDELRRAPQLRLIPELREHDVPREQGHQQQQDEHPARDGVALRPESTEAVRIINFYCVGVSFNIFLESIKSRENPAYSHLSWNLIDMLKQPVVGLPSSVAAT